MKKAITNLAELEEEQRKLKMTMEVTRHELARSLGTNRKQLKSFLFQNVAVPAGLLGLGVAAAKSFSGGKKSSESSHQGNSMVGQFLPLLINLVQTFMLQKQSEKLEQVTEEDSASTEPSPVNDLNPVH